MSSKLSAFNPFKLNSGTPEKSEKNLLAETTRNIDTNVFSPPIARSNSHIIVGHKQKVNDESGNQLNEKAVQAIVDKLGYSHEEVRYLIVNNRGRKECNEDTKGLVLTLYNRFLAE